MAIKEVCSVEDCIRKVIARALCNFHYRKHLKLTRPILKYCGIEGCLRESKAKGWCHTHYERWRRTGTTDDPIASHRRVCSVDGCNNTYRCSNYCNKHYLRWRKFGDPLVVKYEYISGTLEERFWARVDKRGECWLWTGRKSEKGYGSFSDGDRSKLAHRVSYELLVGPIPKELEVDHTCHTKDCHKGNDCPHRACVRISHLELVPHIENIRRGNIGNYVRKPGSRPRKKQCINGHPYAGDNVSFEQKRSTSL